MQLHPALVVSIMAERERNLKRSAERARRIGRRERTARSAPWPP
jgi:hypothetical protein